LCFCQLAFYVPLALIRNLQHFAITNLIATLLILISISTLIYYAVQELEFKEKAPEVVVMFNEHSFYRFIGTSVFIFEGVMALSIPLQQSVRADIREDFPSIFRITLGMIVVSYIMFGALNYCAYGDRTEMVLTSNLPDGLLRCLVQLAYACAVVFTFPLQLFPAVSTLRGFFARHKLSVLVNIHKHNIYVLKYMNVYTLLQAHHLLHSKSTNYSITSSSITFTLTFLLVVTFFITVLVNTQPKHKIYTHVHTYTLKN
jgi:amino acid permease